MCGICGFVNKWDEKKKEKNLDLMLKRIIHRGPDGELYRNPFEVRRMREYRLRYSLVVVERSRRFGTFGPKGVVTEGEQNADHGIGLWNEDRGRGHLGCAAADGAAL